MLNYMIRNNLTDNITLQLSKNATKEETDDQLVSTLLISTYTLIFVLGVGGNSLVLHFYWQKKRRALFDLYVIHLALADLLSSFATPIFFIHQQLTIRSHHHLSTPVCIITNSIGPISVNVSSWILTSIAHERHRGIVQPFKMRFTRGRIHLQVGIIWVLTLALITPYILALDHTTGNCQVSWSNYHLELAYNILLLSLQSILPICSMTYWFLRIATALNGAERKQLFNPTQPSTTTSKRGKRLTRILLVAVLVFTLCSLPYNVFYIVALYIYHYNSPSIQTVDQLLSVNPWLSALTVTSCITNAFVYGGMHAEFRQFLRDRFSSLSLRRRDSFITTTSIDQNMQSTGLPSKQNANESQL